MTLTDAQIEEECVRLRQHAAIAADFYRSLIDSGYPADKAAELVSLWFDYTLGWAE